MHALSIGPWVLALGLVALVAGWVIANGVAWWLHRRGQVDVGTPLWVLLLLAVVAARAAFVASGWRAYWASPWSIVDIRDGGFFWPVGVAVLVAATLVWMWRRPRLRRALAASVGAGLLAWAVVGVAANQLGPPAQPPLPDVALHQLDGQAVHLTALEGKPMVINIWATWCGPCRSEMPMLMRASHELPAVRFVFVDHGEAAATVKNYLRQAGFNAQHVLLDSQGELMHRYNLPGCPATLFVTASGQVQKVHLGALSAAALRVNLQRILAPAAG